MNKIIKKEHLFIACTHGNETTGQSVVNKLLKNPILSNKFDYIIGNPKALEKNTRFTDVDLNRVAPGKKSSKLYEEQRAYELVNIFKKYKHVIDIHTTTANNRIVIILSKIDIYSLSLALAFNINEILIWPCSDPKSKIGPLTKFKDYGIEIEIGIKDFNKVAIEKTYKIISKFLLQKSNRILMNISEIEKKLKTKTIYLVGGKIQKDDIGVSKLKDHKLFVGKKEQFTMLLFGKYLGIFGYKMYKINKNYILDKLV